MSPRRHSVTRPRSEFPADKIERAARRLKAIAEYHRADVGYSNEHERLLQVAIVEARSLMDDLFRVTERWDQEFPVPWTTLESLALQQSRESDQSTTQEPACG
jgi:hypothetical protein